MQIEITLLFIFVAESYGEKTEKSEDKHYDNLINAVYGSLKKEKNDMTINNTKFIAAYLRKEIEKLEKIEEKLKMLRYNSNGRHTTEKQEIYNVVFQNDRTEMIKDFNFNASDHKGSVYEITPIKATGEIEVTKSVPSTKVAKINISKSNPLIDYDTPINDLRTTEAFLLFNRQYFENDEIEATEKIKTLVDEFINNTRSDKNRSDVTDKLQILIEELVKETKKLTNEPEITEKVKSLAEMVKGSAISATTSFSNVTSNLDLQSKPMQKSSDVLPTQTKQVHTTSTQAMTTQWIPTETTRVTAEPTLPTKTTVSLVTPAPAMPKQTTPTQATPVNTTPITTTTTTTTTPRPITTTSDPNEYDKRFSPVQFVVRNRTKYTRKPVSAKPNTEDDIIDIRNNIEDLLTTTKLPPIRSKITTETLKITNLVLQTKSTKRQRFKKKKGKSKSTKLNTPNKQIKLSDKLLQIHAHVMTEIINGTAKPKLVEVFRKETPSHLTEKTQAPSTRTSKKARTRTLKSTYENNVIDTTPQFSGHDIDEDIPDMWE